MVEINPGWAGTRGAVQVIECDYLPACPHCKQPLTKILKYLSKGSVQREAIYSCGACGELLSIGYGIHA
jgi:uncharacterized CHY-type Zn-finger protein